MVAAASFDDAIAITGYTLFINLAVRRGGNTAWDVMHGPLSIIFGILAGGLAALFCSATNLWNNNIKRTLVMFLTGAPFFTFERPQLGGMRIHCFVAAKHVAQLEGL